MTTMPSVRPGPTHKQVQAVYYDMRRRLGRRETERILNAPRWYTCRQPFQAPTEPLGPHLFRVLDEQPGISSFSLAVVLGVPVGKVDDLLSKLIARGVVYKDSDGIGYCLTPVGALVVRSVYRQ